MRGVPSDSSHFMEKDPHPIHAGSCLSVASYRAELYGEMDWPPRPATGPVHLLSPGAMNACGSSNLFPPQGTDVQESQEGEFPCLPGSIPALELP